jgi:hypothetical protein
MRSKPKIRIVTNSPNTEPADFESGRLTNAVSRTGDFNVIASPEGKKKLYIGNDILEKNLNVSPNKNLLLDIPKTSQFRRDCQGNLIEKGKPKNFHINFKSEKLIDYVNIESFKKFNGMIDIKKENASSSCLIF